MSADESFKQGSGITVPSGQNYEIPVGGSLGLLALGYKGVMLWREKRKQSRNLDTEIQGSNQG